MKDAGRHVTGVKRGKTRVVFTRSTRANVCYVGDLNVKHGKTRLLLALLPTGFDFQPWSRVFFLFQQNWEVFIIKSFVMASSFLRCKERFDILIRLLSTIKIVPSVLNLC